MQRSPPESRRFDGSAINSWPPDYFANTSTRNDISRNNDETRLRAAALGRGSHVGECRAYDVQCGSGNRRYTPTAQTLHWLIGLLIVVQFVLASVAQRLPLGVRKLSLLVEHKSVGMSNIAAPHCENPSVSFRSFV
jgi:hypothetical protein